jgi:hypothetical protein
MNTTPPERMEPPEIVAEISSLQRELVTRLTRIQGLSQSLYHRVRRAPPDDNTGVYVRFANNWLRFAGMAHLGVKRASVGDRILRTLTPTPVESFVKPPPKQRAVAPASSPVESLLALYREDSADSPSEDGDASEAE